MLELTLQGLVYLPRVQPGSLGLPREYLAVSCEKISGSVLVDLVSSMVITSACGEWGERGSSVIFPVFPTILLEG